MSRDTFDILRDKQNAANAAKRAKARQPFVSGFCQNVQRELHDPCKTGYISAKDQTWVQCACDCHAAASHEAESTGVLLELPDLIQGSDEWHDQRRGMVTASAVGQLITASTLKPASNDYSRGLTALLVAERITGYTEPTYINDDMLRGIEDEPRAIEKYSEHYAPVVTTGFMVRDYGTHQLGYSPDGLVGADGLVEVKSRRQKKHLQTILSGQVPAENMAQLQCGLLVSGREWLDYISYCGGMPLWVKRVYPDQRWFDAITAAVEQFETTAAEMVAAYRKATTGLPARASAWHRNGDGDLEWISPPPCAPHETNQTTPPRETSRDAWTSLATPRLRSLTS